MFSSVRKFFGARDEEEKEEPVKAEAAFPPSRHFLFPSEPLKAIIDAADMALAEKREDAGELSEADRLLSGYLDLRRGDAEWSAWGYAFSLPGDKGGRVPSDRWVSFFKAKKSESGAVAARSLVGLLNDGLAVWDDAKGELLCPDFILAGFFPASRLPAAGLPGNSDAYLKLYSEGVDFTSSFRPGLLWVRYGHQLQAPKREGMLFRAGSSQNSLMGPVFCLADAIERFNERDLAGDLERTAAWAGVAGLIELSPYKDALSSGGGAAKLVNAAKFTIEVKDGLITPVFIRTKPKRSGGLDSTPLLTPGQMKTLRRRFAQASPLTDYIDLGGRTYVTLSPEIKQMLGVVKAIARRKDGKAKMDLVRDPVGVIRSELAKTLGEDAPAVEAADGVFVETPEFLSDRVTAIGPWEKHEVDIAHCLPGSWFEDDTKRYRLLAGGDWRCWTPDEVEDYVAAAEAAEKDGRESFEFKDENYPLDSQDLERARDTLKVISGERPEYVPEEAEPAEKGEGKEEGKEDGEDEGEAKESVPPALKRRRNLRYGPYIKTNLETLEYKAKLSSHPEFTEPFGGLQGGAALLPHQEECLAWLQGLWREGIPGALLADDMGLGKTLQCLSFIRWLGDNFAKLGAPRTALVIAPLGLLANWAAEAEKYFQGTEYAVPLVIDSACLKRLAKMTDQERLAEFARYAWAVTNYDSVRGEFGVFSNVDWSLIAADEAQRIKNPNTTIAECVKGLKSEFFLAMTGTPVENSFMDLWSVMDAAVPGVMGSAVDFARSYGNNPDIAKAGRELNDLLTGGGRPGAIRLMLRRMKKDGLQKLPLRLEKKVPCVMPPEQASRYEDILNEKKTQEALAGGAGAALVALHRLETCALLGVPEIPDDFEFSDSQIAGSARLTAFFQVLDEIAARKEKALVFLVHKKIQQLLAEAIERRYGLEDHPPQMINGSMSPGVRQKAVAVFMSAPEGQFDVMLLTSRAAGTGLTLTNANNVVHLERWWNPAVEDQCSDRVYRIGQKKDVRIYLPIALSDRRDNAFDAVLDGLLSQKRAKSGAVLAPYDERTATASLQAQVLRARNH